MMKSITTVLLFCALFLYGQKPIAKFSTQLSSNSIAFNDESTGGPQTYFWEFQNGVPSTSTNANPVVVYSGTAPYRAKLTVTNSLGSSTLEKMISNTSGTIIDLSTGRNDDGSLMPININDSDWSVTNASNVTVNPTTRTTYSGWSYAALGNSSPPNSTWITHGSETGYFDYKSKIFTIPEGITDAKLNLRSLSFVRNWTSLVKINSNNTTTATQITATTWMSDGAKGWLNSRSPEVVNYPIAPGTYYINVQLYTNNGSVRGSVDVNANVQYGAGLKSSNTISLSSSSSSFCKGVSSPFNATVEGESLPVTSYNWVFKKGNDSVLAGGQSPNVIFPSVGTYSAKLKVTFSDGSFSSLYIPDYLGVTNNCNKDYTLAPNSYIFTGKDDIGNEASGIYIPVKKAYAMWTQGKYMGGSDIPNGLLTADVLWEDNIGLIKSKADYKLDFVDENDQPINNTQVTEYSKIKVPIDKIKKGNAVIAFRVGAAGNSTDTIYWSWHIWATDDPTNGTSYKSYDPAQRELSDGTIETIPDTEWKWMDRNLGAIGNSITGAGWNKNGGLLYQWGRKDPMPPLVNKGEGFYEVSGSIGNIIHRQAHTQTSGYQVVDNLTKYVSQSNANVIDNIRLSVKNPLSLIYVNQDNTSTQAYYANDNGVYYDVNWFGNVPGLQTYELSKVDLWSDNSKGIVDGNVLLNYNESTSAKPYRQKSSYDPCPNGWRMPSFLVAHATNEVRVDYSPFGVKVNIPGYSVYSASQGVSNIKPGSSSLPDYLKGIKIYPQTGFDMSNVGGNNMGIFPGTGMIDRRDHNGQFSDLHETYLWTATMTMWNSQNLPWSTRARALRLIPDAQQVINNYRPDATNYPDVFGLYNYIPVFGFTTNKALGCRCIKDPLVEKNSYEFKTEFFNETTFYNEGLDNPNTYLITKNTVDEIEIPVSKAFSVQSQILNNSSILEPFNHNDLKANVLWSDKNDLVTNVTVVNPSPATLAQITNTKIKVKIAATKSGNAVITLHNGSINNPVYWSWHVWVSNTPVDSLTYVNDTPIHTDNYVNYTKYGNIMKTKLMDRNIGAIDAFPNVANSTPTATEITLINNSQGFHYQWGRKDPIPVFLNPSGTTYSIYLGNTNSSGVVTYTALTSTNYDATYPVFYNTYKASILPTDNIDTRVAKVLKYSVENPMRFMKPDAAFSPNPSSTNPIYTNGADWLYDSQHSNLLAERWGWGTKKSVFDPCPKGWRIPDPVSGAASSSVTNTKTTPWSFKNNNEASNTAIANTEAGYFGVTVNTGAYGTTKGFMFNNSTYNLGNYPKGYIRGQRNVTYPNFNINHDLSSYNSKSLSGIWYSTLTTNFYGRGSYLGFDRFGRMQVSNTDIDPYTAMNCRCVKQEDVDGGKERGPLPTIPVMPNNNKQATNTLMQSEVFAKVNSDKVVVYPNPVSNLLYLDAKDAEDYYYQIYNMSGQLIKQSKFDNKRTDLSSLPSGVYFIRINDSEQMVKIIKN